MRFSPQLRTRWNNFSIKKKLMFFFSLIILCITLLSTYMLNTAFRYLGMYEEDLVRNATIHNLGKAVARNNLAFENYIMYGSGGYLDDYHAARQDIWRLWNLVWNQMDEEIEAYFQINAIRYGLLAYYESTDLAIALKTRENGGTETGSAQQLSAQAENFGDFSTPLFRARQIFKYIDLYLQNLVSFRLGKVTQLHNELIGRMSTIRLISFGGIFVIALLFIIFGIFFSESITRPIRKLAESSQLISDGILDVGEVPPSGTDEVGVLTVSFNKMSRNIHEMVGSLQDKAQLEKQLMADEVKLIEMDKNLQQAQFLSLQSQIQPHFLFNALNTVSRTAMFEHAGRTVRLIESIANLLRYNLTNQNESITIADELKMLKEYMHIQESRYGSRLTFSILCDEDQRLTAMKIPRFTLQPLVENAVKHGIEPWEEGGAVRVSVKHDPEGNTVIITIEDTGTGFVAHAQPDPGIIRNSGAAAVPVKESTGIGLDNVRRRLEIFFHGQSSLTISSLPGSGTTVTIIIPAETGGNLPC